MTSDERLAGLRPQALIDDTEFKEAVSLFTNLREQVLSLVGTHIHELEAKPEWGLLHQMHERAAAHVGACIVLFSNNHVAAAEALCRTAIEASVNLFYCSLGDSVGHLMTYFKDYIVTERKQNISWLKSVNESELPEAAKKFHLLKIEQKEAALRIYQNTLDQAFSSMGRNFADARDVWPKIFERFKEIRKEIDYRTIYAALCSQAHNDPEDLLNEFVHGLTDIAGLKQKQLDENRNFALYMVFMTLVLLVEASAMYIARFHIDPQPLKATHEAANHAALRVASRDHPETAQMR